MKNNGVSRQREKTDSENAIACANPGPKDRRSHLLTQEEIIDTLRHAAAERVYYYLRVQKSDRDVEHRTS